MGTWTPRMALAAAAALMVALIVGVAPPAEAAPSVPVLTVTPSTGLSNGQQVSLVGTDFPANTTMYLSMCLVAGVGPSCDFGSVQTTPVDGAGNLSATFNVSRLVRPINGDPQGDCAFANCAVAAAGPLLPGPVFAPVQFDDTTPVLPTVTVSPSTGLVDGQTVTVTGSGFQPNEYVSYRRCLPDEPAGSECPSRTWDVRASASGTLNLHVAVDRLSLDSSSTYMDCAVVACSIDFLSAAGSQQVPLSFASPTLTVDISDLATLEAGTDDVVARATVSCDIATPVSLSSSITQPGVDYGYDLLNQRCSPGEPLIAFLPSRVLAENGDHFALGAATVSVSARPMRTLDPRHPATLSTSWSEPVQLIDFAAIKAVVDAGLADPANTELRAQVLQAILLRAAQDPVFRAAWVAAIASGR